MRVPQARAVVGTSAVLGLEAAWLGARVAGYPLGVRHERRRPSREVYRPGALKPHQRGLIGVGDVPVVLVHGLIDNRSVFGVLRRSLRRKGFRHVTTMNYPIVTTDVRSAAQLLADRVSEVCGETGSDQVHIVGHSLGGIVARWYVQQMGGDARVGTLVTLGSPHGGTAMARLLPLSIVGQLASGSETLRVLAGPAQGCRTTVVSVWSEQDEIMVPRTTAKLAHPDLDVRNVRLTGVGHVSMPLHPRVVTEITRALAAPPTIPGPRLAEVHELVRPLRSRAF